MRENAEYTPGCPAAEDESGTASAEGARLRQGKPWRVGRPAVHGGWRFAGPGRIGSSGSCTATHGNWAGAKRRLAEKMVINSLSIVCEYCRYS